MIGSGRMAVFLDSESGWDHEGDLDVLGAFYRLGLRSIRFATQTGLRAAYVRFSEKRYAKR